VAKNWPDRRGSLLAAFAFFCFPIARGMNTRDNFARLLAVA